MPSSEMASLRARELKDEGNKCFQSDDFVGAEAVYSKAINMDPTNPLLYTNRAMARLKLRLYHDVLADCVASLELLPVQMKAHFLIAQAEVELGRLDEAYANAQKAYELCSGRGEHGVDKSWERSLALVAAVVLRCKKEIWERRENERLKTRNELLEELLAAIARGRDSELKNMEGSEKEEAARRWADKEAELRRLWNVAAEKEGKRRVVPDWAIDNITFSVMQDPVMTKTGQSYERASILEHLRRSATDPLTREPLRLDELRPNIGLRAACTEFLEDNGWAVDW